MKFKSLYIFFIVFLFSSCNRNFNRDVIFSDAMLSYSSMNMKAAEDKCNEVLRHSPDFMQAWFLKAKILFYTDRKKEAIKLLKKIKIKFPSFVDGKLFLAKALIETDQLEEANKLLYNLSQDNGNDYRVYRLYSQIAKKKKDLKRNLDYQKKAEQCLEESAMVFLDLASVYRNFGLHEISRSYLEKAEKLVANKEAKKVILSCMEEHK